MIAMASLAPVMLAEVGANARIRGRNVRQRASHNFNGSASDALGADAEATAGSGSLVAAAAGAEHSQRIRSAGRGTAPFKANGAVAVANEINDVSGGRAGVAQQVRHADQRLFAGAGAQAKASTEIRRGQEFAIRAARSELQQKVSAWLKRTGQGRALPGRTAG